MITDEEIQINEHFKSLWNPGYTFTGMQYYKNTDYQ